MRTYARTAIAVLTLVVGGLALTRCSKSSSSSSSSSTMTIKVNATNVTEIASGFSGFNSEHLGNVAEFWDSNLIAMTKRLNSGWFRFPAGLASDAYNWSDGQIDTAMMTTMSSYNNSFGQSILSASQKLAAAKGGVFFSNSGHDFATYANAVGAQSIICLNGFTDTAASAGNFATAVKSNGLTIAAWEVTNEPYYFVGAAEKFTSESNYASQMAPYAAAIQAVIPSATVTAFFAGNYPGYGLSSLPDPNWDTHLQAVPAADHFWNAASVHVYPLNSDLGSIDADMEFLNGVLDTGTNQYFTDTFLPLIGSSMPVYISELDPAANNLSINVTMYGAVWNAEYILRVSSLTNIKRVGVSMSYNEGTYNAMINSGTSGIINYVLAHGPMDTSSLNFNYFLTVPGVALGTLNMAVNAGNHIWATSVSGGGSVSTQTGTMNAIYAQAYQGNDGYNYVAITNKSASSQVANIVFTGYKPPSSATVYTVSSTNPSATNTFSTTEVKQVVSSASTSAVTLPAYSVVVVKM